MQPQPRVLMVMRSGVFPCLATAERCTGRQFLPRSAPAAALGHTRRCCSCLPLTLYSRIMKLQ